MEILGIIVTLITLGIALFALHWARKEEVVQPKEVAAVRGDEAKGVYPGIDQDDVAGDEAAAKGEEATEVGHAAGSEERITPVGGEVTTVRGDEAKGVYPGIDQDDVAGDEAAAEGEEATEVGHAAGSEERITPVGGDAGAGGSGGAAPRRRRRGRARP